MPHPTPVSAQDRIETLDVLRGFALLGILAMNIRGMAAPLSTYMYPYALFDYSGASRAAYLFTSVVFDLKMMGLFSMLNFIAGAIATSVAGRALDGAAGFHLNPLQTDPGGFAYGNLFLVLAVLPPVVAIVFQLVFRAVKKPLEPVKKAEAA